MKRLFIAGKIKVQLYWLNNRHVTDLKNRINRMFVCDDRFDAAVCTVSISASNNRVGLI